MELEILARRDNPLLKRTEVRFVVVHGKEPSPPRAALREALARTLNATRDIVVVEFARPEFGRSTSKGYAKVYKSKEDALRTERKHILVRNGLLAAEVKAEKVRAPKPTPPRREAAAKPAEKPAAPAKEEKPTGKEEKKPEAKGPAEKKEAKPAAAKKEEKKPEAKKGGKEGK
jgi:small subunit ribosomal protein S24e